MKDSRVRGNLEKLLKNTYRAYYWIGFLMADGSINYKTYRLKIGLSMRDKIHLLRFADYINCPNVRKGNNNSIELSIQDKYNIPKIIKKFGFVSRKSFNACNLFWLDNVDKNFFISFLIGFIDGDGCINYQTNRKDCAIRIKIHSSWFNNLQLLSNKICKPLNLMPNKVHINNKGYSLLGFNNSIILNFLRRKTKELRLPVLNRKWDKIDISFKSRIVRSIERKEKIKDLLKQDINQTSIAKLLGMSKSGVSLLIKRNNLKKKVKERCLGVRGELL